MMDNGIDSIYAELWAAGIDPAELADREELRRLREFQFGGVAAPYEERLRLRAECPTKAAAAERHAAIRGLEQEWEDEVYPSIVGEYDILCCDSAKS